MGESVDQHGGGAGIPDKRLDVLVVALRTGDHQPLGRTTVSAEGQGRELLGRLRGQPGPDRRDDTRRHVVGTHGDLEEGRLLTQVALAAADRIPVDDPGDRRVAVQDAVEDDAAGAHRDRRDVGDTGSAQVVQGVADAGLPVTDRVGAGLVERRVTAAEIVEPEYQQSAGSQLVAEQSQRP